MFRELSCGCISGDKLGNVRNCEAHSRNGKFSFVGKVSVIRYYPANGVPVDQWDGGKRNTPREVKREIAVREYE